MITYPETIEQLIAYENSQFDRLNDVLDEIAEEIDFEHELTEEKRDEIFDICYEGFCYWGYYYQVYHEAKAKLKLLLSEEEYEKTVKEIIGATKLPPNDKENGATVRQKGFDRIMTKRDFCLIKPEEN